MSELFQDLMLLLFLTPIGWGVIILVVGGLIMAACKTGKKVVQNTATPPISEEDRQAERKRIINEVRS
jgi:hypothetical protein